MQVNQYRPGGNRSQISYCIDPFRILEFFFPVLHNVRRSPDLQVLRFIWVGGISNCRGANPDFSYPRKTPYRLNHGATTQSLWTQGIPCKYQYIVTVYSGHRFLDGTPSYGAENCGKLFLSLLNSCLLAKLIDGLKKPTS